MTQRIKMRWRYYSAAPTRGPAHMSECWVVKKRELGFNCSHILLVYVQSEDESELVIATAQQAVENGNKFMSDRKIVIVGRGNKQDADLPFCLKLSTIEFGYWHRFLKETESWPAE